MSKVDLTQVRAIDFQEARIVAVDALQQPRDGGLAQARPPDDAEHRAGGPDA
jgi:hypothetical protein